ncbi:carbon storage regulator [Dethiosulfovibrio sp. F2B]|nr:carbon storage regulator [Dethiosulfovibrio faecalis]
MTVLEIRGDSLKLGIDAPAYVPIWRTEVLEDIKEQNRLAASKDNDNDVLRIGELLSGKKHEKQ